MSTYVLNHDVETRSVRDLLKVGTHIYAQDPSTRILCCSYSLDACKTMSLWTPWTGQKMPSDLADALHDPDVELQGWNAASFERLIFKFVAGIDIKVERYHDTMIRARSMALPGKLELCALALDTPVKKADDAMMRKWSQPLKTGGWADDPGEFAILCDYCHDDTRSETLIGSLLRPLSAEERTDNAVSLRINDRGLLVDVSLARMAQRYAKEELADICDRLNTLTAGAIDGAPG